MSKQFVVRQSVRINAPRPRVWEALVNPSMIREYMFGADVISSWKEDSPIVFRGEWQGRTYEDRGKIIKLEPGKLLQYSHFSPLSGLPDTPENYHTVTVQLSSDGGQTVLSLSQDNNPTEEAREHSEKNWAVMLAGLKKLVER